VGTFCLEARGGLEPPGVPLAHWKEGSAIARKDEGVLDILVQLPWWVSVCVAAGVYVGLKFVLPAQLAHDSLLKPFATVGTQYAALVAAILLVPGAVSAMRSSRKRRMLEAQSGIDSIRSLSWKQFEELLAEAFRRQGYAVQENLYGGADGGIDLTIRRDGNVYLVQCKQWRSFKVGVKVVREMLGLVTAHSAQGGIVVTSGVFTREAETFASRSSVYLIDGRRLDEMIRAVQPRPVAGAHVQPLRPASPTCAGKNPAAYESTRPSTRVRRCPRCGSDLVLREARRGSHAGTRFWGCSSYPNCRHTEEYAG